MRSDALLRRKKLLKEARRLFAELGREVSLETIATNSGVGIATLYRNFSSREELVNAVTRETIVDVNDATERLERSELSADRVWYNFVHQLASFHLGALTEVMSGSTKPMLSLEVYAEQQKLMHRLDRALRTLQDARIIRGEVTAVSLIAAIAVITRPQSASIRDHAPGLHGQLIEAYLIWSRETRLDS